MKTGWLAIVRPTDEAAADGVESEAFVYIYTRLPKAKKACSEYIEQVETPLQEGQEEETELNKKIVWTESKEAGRKKYVGMPEAEVEYWFDLYQVTIK